MGSELSYLSVEDAVKLWNLSSESLEHLRQRVEADTQALIAFAEAETKAILDRIKLESEADKQLQAATDENVKKGIREDLEKKKEAIAQELSAKRDSIAEKLGGKKRVAEVRERGRLKARLLDPNDKSALDTTASQAPKRYYVIVGRGTAAVLNHTTLRQSDFGQKRLKDPKNANAQLPVLHVGMPDPWFHYFPHGMGQPPYLLALPGYHYRPDWRDREIRSGMNSWDFSFKNLQEWALLKFKYKFEHLEGWVGIIQKKDQPWDGSGAIWEEISDIKSKLVEESKKKFELDCAFRVLVVLPNQKIVHVYAEKVDMCTGLPRATVEPGKQHHELKPPLAEGRPRLWDPPDAWDDAICDRKVVTGPEALIVNTNWSSSQRIFVNGAGGIGLNMVERSEDEKNTLDWVHYQFLHQNSFGLRRNDTVLKDPKTNGPCKPGESGLRDDDEKVIDPKSPTGKKNLYPCSKAWRFGRNAAPDYANIKVDGTKLSVPISVKDASDTKIHDHFGKEVSLAGNAFPFSDEYLAANSALAKEDGVKGRFDRLCCCSGQMASSLGSPQCMAPGFNFSGYEKDGTMVCLQAEGAGADAGLRILGAAVTTHDNYPALVGNAKSATKDYFMTLPVSAVPPGFIFSGINIAVANGFFDKQKNTNANVLKREEIVALLKEKSVAPDLAEKVAQAIENRRRPANGFKSCFAALDYLREKKDEVTKLSGWDSAVLKLDFAYREGGKFLP